MARSASNEPVTTTESETQKAFQLMLNQMELAATSDDSEFTSPMVASFVAIATADTEEEMWDADEFSQIGGRNLEDVEQSILEYTVKFSSNQEIQSVFVDSKGRKMYLLVRAARLTNGEEFIWNTSAPLVVGKILWLANHNRIPGAEVVIKGKGPEGSRVLMLKPVPKRATRAESEPPF